MAAIGTFEPAIILYPGNLGLQSRSQGTLGDGPGGHVLEPDVLYDTVYPVGMFLEAVEIAVVVHPEQQQDGPGHARRQSENVNRGSPLVFPDVPQDEFQAGSKHDRISYGSGIREPKTCQFQYLAENPYITRIGSIGCHSCSVAKTQQSLCVIATILIFI